MTPDHMTVFFLGAFFGACVCGVASAAGAAVELLRLAFCRGRR
jgi:hypothetical protein